MLHHSGASGGDYHRLVSRLSPDRLAVAMPYTATRLRSNLGPEGALTFLSASPATIACLAALLPETHATTLVLSGELSRMLVSCDLGQGVLLRRLQNVLLEPTSFGVHQAALQRKGRVSSCDCSAKSH